LELEDQDIGVGFLDLLAGGQEEDMKWGMGSVLFFPRSVRTFADLTILG